MVGRAKRGRTMEPKQGPGQTLRDLFHGIVEQVFMTELGVCNPRLSDYVGDILTDFVHVDRIYRLHTVDGRVIREVSQMEAEACLGPQAPGTLRTRLINRYIGDFTLFWTGVYPEALRLRGSGGNRLHEYLLTGKRSYGIASDLSEREAHPPPDLLKLLSREFELCVHGLSRVRAEWQALALRYPRN